MKEVYITLHDGDMITPLRNMTVSVAWDENRPVPYKEIREKAVELVNDWRDSKNDPDTAKRFYGDDDEENEVSRSFWQNIKDSFRKVGCI